MKSVSILTVLFSIGLVGLAVACTKTITRVVPAETVDAGKDSGLPKTKPSGDDDTTADDDDSAVEDAAPPKDAGPVSCKKEKLRPACEQCCGKQHAAGYKVIQDAIKACACAPADACLTQCKTTLCAGKPITQQACATCANDIQATDACQATIQEQCGADDDCLAFNQCVQDSACGGKPLQ